MKNLQVRIYTDLTTEPVSLTEAKAICRAPSGTQDDALLAILIKSARQSLEQYTQSSFASKKIHATWIESPKDDIFEIPYGPIISIDAVYRIDEEGTEELLTLNSDYFVFGDQDAVIKISKYWSSGIVSASSIRVEYTAGYGNAATETLPEPLKLAILKEVATQYELREDIGVGMTILSNESKKIAGPYRKKLWV
jgi:uncharacterized phiE125 gp8 family phage protein